MTQEEKAKAYDEALKQIKECVPDDNGFITIYPQEIFPELAESEDERIRKELIDIVAKSPITFAFEDKGKVLAWLEKQGEQKPAWSEEDYNEIETIACHLDNIDNEGMAEVLRSIRDKYYHIIPQSTWKPSDDYIGMQNEIARLRAKLRDFGCEL